MKLPLDGTWDQTLRTAPPVAYPPKKLTPETEAARKAVIAVPADHWFEMSKWAKDRGFLEGWERSLVFSLGKLAARGAEPSDKQAIQGARILGRALELGLHGRCKPYAAGISARAAISTWRGTRTTLSFGPTPGPGGMAGTASAVMSTPTTAKSPFVSSRICGQRCPYSHKLPPRCPSRRININL